MTFFVFRSFPFFFSFMGWETSIMGWEDSVLAWEASVVRWEILEHMETPFV